MDLFNSIKTKYEKNKNKTGFGICISSHVNCKTSITCISRTEPGSLLEIQSIDNASDFQVYAVCNCLDEL